MTSRLNNSHLRNAAILPAIQLIDTGNGLKVGVNLRYNFAAWYFSSAFQARSQFCFAAQASASRKWK